jgi:L-fucose isomerase-like protein
MARDHGHSALAVSDWPALQADPGMHPGAAFSWLEEADALPVASEGDVLGAVTQLVVRGLTGRLGCLLDMTEPDHRTGQLLVWHGGGGPLHLADGQGAAWIDHPMIGRAPGGRRLGAIADYVFAPGPVTLARIARHGRALFRMTAEVVPREPPGFLGARGWLQGFRIGDDPASLGDVVATVMAHGLDHHVILMPGDLGADWAEIGAWAAMAPLSRRPWRDHLDSTDFT